MGGGGCSWGARRYPARRARAVTLSLSHSLSHTLSLSCTHSLTHNRSLSLTHTLSLSHTWVGQGAGSGSKCATRGGGSPTPACGCAPALFNNGQLVRAAQMRVTKRKKQWQRLTVSHQRRQPLESFHFSRGPETPSSKIRCNCHTTRSTPRRLHHPAASAPTLPLANSRAFRSRPSRRPSPPPFNRQVMSLHPTPYT